MTVHDPQEARPVARIAPGAARAAYDTAAAEARAIIARLDHTLDATPAADVHWGHVGSLTEVVRHLKLAAHYAGVADEGWGDL